MKDKEIRIPSKKGFTVLEILMVLAIIALLAGVLLVGLGGVFEGAQEDIAKTFVTQVMKTPLMRYKMHMGGFPSTQEGLNALLNAPANAKASRWRGPYIDELPDDPWGNPYQYRSPASKGGKGYDLFSYGQDERESDDDIGNWD